MDAEGGTRSLAALHRVDEVCLRFEDDWRAGRRPGAAAYLGAVPADEREALLAELLLLEWDYRFREGESFFPDEYARRHGEMRAAVDRAWARWKGREPVALDTATAGDTGGDRSSTVEHRPAVFSLPGYEQVELLSRGGMGEVYKAFDPRLRRWVALKQVRLEHAEGEALGRFRLEAEALARLAHPHIVKVHGLAEHEGQPILEMEYVAGGTLEGRLRGAVAAGEAARLVAVLAWAVHAAHEKGIVHRDLKPANVLMDEPVPGGAGNVLGGWPKVSDFGLAGVRDAAGGHTLPGSVLGTPAYMAPEQAAGRTREVGPASDVWALGVMLYRAVAGSLPFEGDSVLDTLERVKTMQMRPLREALPGVPAELEAAVGACLRREPGQRPTARELAERLERFVAGGGALPLSPLPQGERGGDARAGGDGETGALAAPPLPLREGAGGRGHGPQPLPQGERGSRRRLVALGGVAAALAAGVVAAAVWWPRGGEGGGDAGPETPGVASEGGVKEGPLGVVLRVKHYPGGEDDLRRPGVIGAGSQEAWYDDLVVVEVEAKRPAYFYLVAFNCDGKEQLLWPKEGEAPPAREKLTYPPPNPATGKDRAIKLDDHKDGGTQAFVVVASRKALPAYAEWVKERGERPWRQMAPKRGVWRSDGETVKPVNEGDGLVRGSVVNLKGQPPLLGLARWAKGPGVEAVEAVAFPVYRREGQ